MISSQSLQKNQIFIKQENDAITFRYLSETDLFHGGFYGKNHLRQDIQIGNSKLYLISLQQTHSDITQFQSKKDSQEKVGDAHWTQLNQCGLLVKTADCIPLLIFSPKDKIHLSIHAGWKGVAQQIIIKSIQSIKTKLPQLNCENLIVLVGPHIHQASFEIDRPVCDQLLKSTPPLGSSDKLIHPEESEYFFQKNSKFYFNLELAAINQLLYAGLLKERIFTFDIDTRTDTKWHSFRRERELSGRNLSYIAREEQS